MIQRLALGKIKLNIEMKEFWRILKNRKNRRRIRYYKNIDKYLDVNIPNPIA